MHLKPPNASATEAYPGNVAIGPVCPQPEMRVYTRSDLRSVGPRPQPSMIPGLKFSRRTSHLNGETKKGLILNFYSTYSTHVYNITINIINISFLYLFRQLFDNLPPLWLSKIHADAQAVAAMGPPPQAGAALIQKAEGSEGIPFPRRLHLEDLCMNNQDLLHLLY